MAASAREVFDVVGAGDTVVATLALALGAGWPLAESARLANAAAGLVVGKHGAATVSQSELLDELGRISLIETGQSETKYSRVPSLVERRKQWAKDGLTVGFTNGCFDILHIGHLHTLEFARKNCDRLIVAINGDDSVRRLKGSGRPINGVEDRVRMLSALTFVDAVVVFDDDTPERDPRLAAARRAGQRRGLFARRNHRRLDRSRPRRQGADLSVDSRPQHHKTHRKDAKRLKACYCLAFPVPRKPASEDKDNVRRFAFRARNMGRRGQNA